MPIRFAVLVLSAGSALLAACAEPGSDPSGPTGAGSPAVSSAVAWGPEDPRFNLQVILRSPDGGAFGLVKFRQPNDDALIISLDTWVHGLAPNTSYALQREVDLSAADGICTGESGWLTLGEGLTPQAITTDADRTGREALFSQPVRYAFRQTEWQRSVDADTLLRSTTTLTNGLIGAFFTDTVASAGRTAPAGLVIRANHGGELLDLLRVPWADTAIVADHATVRANRLVPVRVKESASNQQVSVSTVWADTSGTVSLNQSVTVWRDSAAMRLTQWSPGNQIQMVLRPARGVAITSFASHGQEANVCFTQFGDSQPCLRIWLSQSDATMSHGRDGVLRVATRDSDRLNLLVTALTAGAPSVGLGLLHPSDLVESRKVGAALLYAPDPGYLSQARRLEAIGFRDAFAAGPYRVLLRDRPAIHPGGRGR